MEQARILVVDDEEPIRWSLKARLEESGFTVGEAGSGEEARRVLAEGRWSLVLLDQHLGDLTALEFLAEMHEGLPDLPVIVMTAHATVEAAVEAMKRGAFDYLTKPVNHDELILLIRRALETETLRKRATLQKREQSRRADDVAIVGTSPAMEEVRGLIEKVARSRAATILLLGESGTGKSLLARAIHAHGPRRDRPFVNITCSALPETLLESELFGHEQGAFTDAKSRKRGLFELADGGTVFLDEIGEMGLALQAKLLRALEEKTFKRLGGDRDIRVDVRVVAATNRVLKEEVDQRRFREDLYYRLNVFPILIPPLRDRPEDIPSLVSCFLESFNAELGRETEGVEPEAMLRLVAYDWPGNVRELRNIIERIMILEDRTRIGVEDLPGFMFDVSSPGDRSSDSVAPTVRQLIGEMTLAEIEVAAIREALLRSDGNQVHAARLLGLSRDTLRYRMRKTGLLPEGRGER